VTNEVEYTKVWNKGWKKINCLENVKENLKITWEIYSELWLNGKKGVKMFQRQYSFIIL
jgi:hypothetical protein